jgi:hypothetical protein
LPPVSATDFEPLGGLGEAGVGALEALRPAAYLFPQLYHARCRSLVGDNGENVVGPASQQAAALVEIARASACSVKAVSVGMAMAGFVGMACGSVLSYTPAREDLTCS